VGRGLAGKGSEALKGAAVEVAVGGVMLDVAPRMTCSRWNWLTEMFRLAAPFSVEER
jgi:hypothetical protein